MKFSRIQQTISSNNSRKFYFKTEKKIQIRETTKVPAIYTIKNYPLCVFHRSRPYASISQLYRLLAEKFPH